MKQKKILFTLLFYLTAIMPFNGHAQVKFEEDCLSFVLTNEGNDQMIERLVAAGCTNLYQALVYLRNNMPGDAPATLTGNMDALITELNNGGGEVFAPSLTDFVGGNNPVGINSDGTFIRADFSIYSYDGHSGYARYSGNELYTYATSPDYYIYMGSNEVDLGGGITKETNYKAFAVAWNMTNTLSVSTNTLNVASANGSTATFNVTSNISWTAASNQTWLAVSPTNSSGNGTVTVTAQANPLSTTRTAMVTVSGSGVTSQTVTVTQAAGAATLSILPTTLDIGATEGSTATFNVTSNISWTAASNQTWLAVSPTNSSGNGTVTITAQANPLSTTRTATVTVSGSGITSQTVTVTQAAGTATETECLSFVLTNEGNDQMIERLVAAGCTSLYQALVYLRNNMPGDAPATLTGNMDALITELNGGGSGEVVTASLTDFVGGNNPVGINSDGTFVRADFSIYSYDGHPGYARYSGNELYTYATSPDYYIDMGSNEIDLGGGITKTINYKAFAVAWNMEPTTIVLSNEEGGFKIYPNPVHDIVKFSLPTNETVKTINIYNDCGTLVGQICNPKNNEIDFSNKPTGWYLIRFETKTNCYSEKIIKQ